MSWKSLVCTSLICALASPVFAQPSLDVIGGRANASGDRVWGVTVTPDAALFGTNPDGGPDGGSLAIEVGLRALGGSILDVFATNNMPSRIEFDDNPGNVVFGWEDLTTGEGDNFPEGIQVNGSEAFAAVGTNFLTNSNANDILTVVTQGSVTGLEFGGRYNPDGTLGSEIGAGALLNARVAQAGNNFDTFSGSVSPAVVGGSGQFTVDMNGDGLVNFGDLTPTVTALQDPAAYAAQFPHLNRVDRGDASGDGLFNFGDLSPIVDFLTGDLGSGSGAVAVAAVPEPSSAGLVLLGCLGGLLFRRRRG